MEIFKILAIAIIAAILCFYLKSINSELFVLALIASGAIILSFSIEYLIIATNFFNDLLEKVSVDKSLIVLTLKIAIIAYLIEFAASLIEDFGLKSLSEKLVFAGKILLFCLSLPIIRLLTETVFAFLK